jgi:hypothetical protein
MDITKMLAELKAEREGIEQAIIVLQNASLPVGASAVVARQLGCRRLNGAEDRREVRTSRRNHNLPS